MARVENADAVDVPTAAEGQSPGAGEIAAPEGHAPRSAMATRSFKLRFAAHSEPGRSNISVVRPLGLPAPVTDKFYTRSGQRGTGQAETEAEARALASVRARIERGPRDLYPHPVTTAHELGWWCGAWCGGQSAVSRHHIRDSAWLRTRLRLLALDAAFKRH